MAKTRTGSRKRATRAPKRLARARENEGGASNSALQLADPIARPLKAYAFDPSRGKLLDNEMSLTVRYEKLIPGPVVEDPFTRDGIAIIDYDATNNVYYTPVNLDDPAVLIRGGLDPVEADPRFHQQMVYAVVTETIQHFEAALGRRIHWRRICREEPKRNNDANIYTLNIFPHAMEAANAFYSPKAHGILFGYFRADVNDPGCSIPGQLVYTCLSHDIVVHETTHAIIDGIRCYFTEQTNPDVCAFHEAFADLAALFRHFSHDDVLIDTIQRTGGMLYEAETAADARLRPGAAPTIVAQLAQRNPLIELAQQFGEATGRGKGLRSALDSPPKSSDMQTKLEPHARGSILVAAVFDAFFQIYMRRSGEVLKIYRAGSGGSHVGTDLPVPLARMLARQASRTATMFFNICVRALDYCPPVDITFGDFLRAVITADLEVHPTDQYRVRDAFMQAFRARGIVPDGASFFSEIAIAWPAVTHLPPVIGLEFGDPNGLTHSEQDDCRKVLQAYLDVPANRALMGFDEKLPIYVPSFHPMFRVDESGSVRTDMVVEAVQVREAQFDRHNRELGSFPFRGGATLIIAKPSLDEIRRQEATESYVPHGKIRYVIAKHLSGEDGMREDRQRNHYERAGLVEGSDPDRFHIDFALTHGAR